MKKATLLFHFKKSTFINDLKVVRFYKNKNKDDLVYKKDKAYNEDLIKEYV